MFSFNATVAEGVSGIRNNG